MPVAAKYVILPKGDSAVDRPPAAPALDVMMFSVRLIRHPCRSILLLYVDRRQLVAPALDVMLFTLSLLNTSDHAD